MSFEADEPSPHVATKLLESFVIVDEALASKCNTKSDIVGNVGNSLVQVYPVFE